MAYLHVAIRRVCVRGRCYCSRGESTRRRLRRRRNKISFIRHTLPQISRLSYSRIKVLWTHSRRKRCSPSEKKVPLCTWLAALPTRCSACPFFRLSRIDPSDLSSSLQRAAGVAPSFGATFGGVLSISHDHALYGWASSSGDVCGRRGRTFGESNWMGDRFELFSTTKEDMSTPVFTMFILLGIMCGVIGALFNYMLSLLLRVKARLLSRVATTASPIARSESEAERFATRASSLSKIMGAGAQLFKSLGDAVLRVKLLAVGVVLLFYLIAMYAADNPPYMSNTDFVRGLFRSFEEEKSIKDDGFHTLGLPRFCLSNYIHRAVRCSVDPSRAYLARCLRSGEFSGG